MDLSWLRTNLMLARMSSIRECHGSVDHTESQRGDADCNGLNIDYMESAGHSNSKTSLDSTTGSKIPSQNANSYHIAIYQASNDVMRQALTNIHQLLQSCLADSKEDGYNVDGKIALDMLKSAVNCRPTKQTLSSDMEYANLVVTKCRQLANEFRSLLKKYHDLNQIDNDKHQSILRNLEQEFNSKYEQEKSMLLKEMSLNQRIYEEKARIIFLEYQRKLADRDQEVMKLRSHYNEFFEKQNSEKTNLMAQMQRLEDALKSEQKTSEQCIEEQKHLRRKELIEYDTEKQRLLTRIEDLEDRLMNCSYTESTLNSSSTLGYKPSFNTPQSISTDVDSKCRSEFHRCNHNSESRNKTHLGEIYGDFDSSLHNHFVRRRKPVPLREIESYLAPGGTST